MAVLGDESTKEVIICLPLTELKLLLYCFLFHSSHVASTPSFYQGRINITVVWVTGMAMLRAVTRNKASRA